MVLAGSAWPCSRGVSALTRLHVALDYIPVKRYFQEKWPKAKKLAAQHFNMLETGMMKGYELREIRKASRLNQEAFGLLVAHGRVAVSDWERNVNTIPGAVELIARILAAHPELLPEMERWRGLRE